jgi:hypothetical protein
VRRIIARLIELEHSQRLAKAPQGDEPGLSTQRVRWLEQSYERLRETKLSEAPELSKVALAYSFPTKGAASGSVSTRVGEWIGSELSGSPNGERQLIVIHPMLWEDPAEVLGTLAHEMCHACTPDDGHGAKFAALAKRIGLVGKPTQAGAGAEFRAWVDAEFTSGKLAPFPAGAVAIHRRKVQGTRMRLYECACDPPVKVRCARDDLRAECQECGELFELKAPKTPTRFEKKPVGGRHDAARVNGQRRLCARDPESGYRSPATDRESVAGAQAARSR